MGRSQQFTDEAAGALRNLGYNDDDISAHLGKLDPSLGTSERLRLSLRSLTDQNAADHHARVTLHLSQAPQSPAEDPPCPPAKTPYYSAMREGAKHREAMAGMSVKERHEYTRGLREGLQQDDRPKRGDLDNPLTKDMPKEPKAPKEPAPPRAPRPRTTMQNARSFGSLARKAGGRRRR